MPQTARIHHLHPSRPPRTLSRLPSRNPPLQTPHRYRSLHIPLNLRTNRSPNLRRRRNRPPPRLRPRHNPTLHKNLNRRHRPFPPLNRLLPLLCPQLLNPSRNLSHPKIKPKTLPTIFRPSIPTYRLRPLTRKIHSLHPPPNTQRPSRLRARIRLHRCSDMYPNRHLRLFPRWLHNSNRNGVAYPDTSPRSSCAT